MQAVVKPGK